MFLKDICVVRLIHENCCANVQLMFALAWNIHGTYKQTCLVMSNASGTTTWPHQQQYSIVEYIGYNEGGLCGYCRQKRAVPTSFGIQFCFNYGIELFLLSLTFSRFPLFNF